MDITCSKLRIITSFTCSSFIGNQKFLPLVGANIRNFNYSSAFYEDPKIWKTTATTSKEIRCKNLINQIDIQSEKEWINARNVAVITLLYGCGLRISEALSLTFGQTPLPDVLNIIGKGNKERIIPVLPIAQLAVKKYLKECPYFFFTRRLFI